MKKIFLLAFSLIFTFLLVGCGCSNDKTPSNFQVYNIELGGLTQQEFEVALKEGVNDYYINVTLDDDKFPVSGKSISIEYNEALDLTDAVKKINKGSLTAEDIEAELLYVGDEIDVEHGLKESYLAFLQAKLSTGQAMQEEAAAEGKDTVSVTVKDQDDDSAKADGTTVTAGISSVLSESGAAAIENAEDGETVEVAVLTEEEMAVIQEKINSMDDVTKARIEYSDDKGQYIGVDGIPGEARDFSKASKQLLESAKVMDKEATLTTSIEYKEGELVSESKDIQTAIDEANSYLTLTITNNISLPNGKSAKDEISGKDIHNYLFVGLDGRTLEIDQDAITLHATAVAKANSDVDETREEDKKKVTITRKGYEVSSQELYENIYKCLDEKQSGTFDIKYKDVNETTTSETDSTYVHVDLDSQTCTLYVDGEAVASDSIVSGCVEAGHATPSGTYHIYYKARNTVLRGADYSCFVNFWMPFNGGIGLHDASWKSTFGGTEYFYGGSHGCINMPYSLAETVYNNVKSGTKVIVTGGVRSLAHNDPNLRGTTSYSLKPGDKVTLDATADSDGDFSYSSSDNGVVTVDDNGNVTAVGVGFATVEVVVRRTSNGNYDGDEMTVYFDVTDPTPTTKATTQETSTTAESTTAETSSSETSTVGPE